MLDSYNLTLLYIEDNPKIRENIAGYLQERGMRVIEAQTAEHGCDLFRSNKVDIVLTDLHLPNQSGIEFVRCLRSKNLLTPVIVTTAYTDKEFLLDAINLDVTRYLVKPFKKTELIDALKVAAKKVALPNVISYTPLHGDYGYDPVNKWIIVPDADPVQLSKKEYLLFELLLSQKRQTIPYEVIESIVWKNAPMSIDALRTLVRGIRKKTYPEIISNVNGIGYRVDL